MNNEWSSCRGKPLSGPIAIGNTFELGRDGRERRQAKWGEVWDNISPSLKAIFYLPEPCKTSRETGNWQKKALLEARSPCIQTPSVSTLGVFPWYVY